MKVSVRTSPTRFFARVVDYRPFPNRAALIGQVFIVLRSFGHQSGASPATVSVLNGIERRKPAMSVWALPFCLRLAVRDNGAKPQETALFSQPTEFLLCLGEVSGTFKTPTPPAD
jgi:hypothetical protein